MDGKNLLLSHGDFKEPSKYHIYSKFIRNKYLLKTLNIADNILSNKISKNIITKQLTKDKCKKIPNFQQKIKAFFTTYHLPPTTCHLIDGHHHQNVKFKINNIKYQNLSAFACNKSFFVVNSDEIYLKEQNV
jgi:UDP-2,3-diacylglucosamine hydrolase